LTGLRELDLSGTAVTDAGLADLARLTGLKRLYLWDTDVTESGGQRLKAALPECEVKVSAKRKPR
jgi:hypothetical protein